MLSTAELPPMYLQEGLAVIRSRSCWCRRTFRLMWRLRRKSSVERTGPEVELGWVIARPAWGRGYATEASRAWLDVGFDTLGLDEIVAVIRRENASSHRVAERLGMERRGTRAAYGHELDLYVARR